MFGLRLRKTPKILIVDDDETILETLKERLEFNDVTVLLATNGREGLSKAMLHKPDIIVTDISMPLMNGIEMIKAIFDASASKCVPVIVISGAEDVEHDLKIASLEIDEFLSKPFEMSELLGKIEKLLEGSAQQMSLR